MKIIYTTLMCLFGIACLFFAGKVILGESTKSQSKQPRIVLGDWKTVEEFEIELNTIGEKKRIKTGGRVFTVQWLKPTTEDGTSLFWAVHGDLGEHGGDTLSSGWMDPTQFPAVDKTNMWRYSFLSFKLDEKGPATVIVRLLERERIVIPPTP